MTWKMRFLCVVGVGLLVCGAGWGQAQTQWKPHDMNRPAPTVVDPGVASTQDVVGRAPSDAVVLFDGKDLSEWAQKDGSPAKWKLGSGYFETVPKSGYIYTKKAFGDCQLHVEFARPRGRRARRREICGPPRSAIATCSSRGSAPSPPRQA